MIRKVAVRLLALTLAWEAQILQELGYFEKSQSLRKRVETLLKINSRRELREWAQKVLASDIRLGEIAQEEEHLSAELRALPGGADSAELSPAEVERQELLVRRVDELCQEYHRQRVRHAKIEESLPYDAICWGYEQHRARPQWHMKSDKLVEHCQGEGGCCARNCGCCSKPRGKKIQHYGHCTLECACCRRARGFGGESEEDRALFQLDLRPDTTDTRTLDRMSFHIWGAPLFFR